MKRVINLDNWNRKEHFKFFSALDDPFMGHRTKRISLDSSYLR